MKPKITATISATKDGNGFVVTDRDITLQNIENILRHYVNNYIYVTFADGSYWTYDVEYIADENGIYSIVASAKHHAPIVLKQLLEDFTNISLGKPTKAQISRDKEISKWVQQRENI